ncbi:MAG: S16 family serine protease [bacterium]|nr:S16 family serine protease [bacterium]
MKRWRPVAWLLLVLTVGTVTARHVSREYLVVSPGVVRDAAPMISVGGLADPGREGFLVTTVYAAEPSPAEMVRALGRRGSTLVRRRLFTLPGETLDDYQERAGLVMAESQRLAVVAALLHLGHDATLAGDGAQVAYVLPGGRLDGQVAKGDTIVALDGRPIHLAADLAAETMELRLGAEVVLLVEDAGGHRREISTYAGFAGGPELTLGLSVVTRAPRVEGSVEVTIEAGEIGGPSAGLAFALEIVDRLHPDDLVGGRRIAATGTVAQDGRVGPVGGVPFKVWAAEREGADLLLVPLTNLAEAQAAARRLQVVAVASLEEAVSRLGESR